MLFDNVNNHGKNNRIDPMPNQWYGNGFSLSIIEKIKAIVKKDVYSYYRGNGSESFWGGSEVKKLEKSFEQYLGNDTKCLAVNSCTSALIVACAAIGIEPGDEVIVSPWSMVCSATAPMHFGGIPVFADIEKEYFCLDPDNIENKITEKTKAIIVVDLFGQPADYDRIMEIAEKHNLYVIEDAAQAIGSWKWTDREKTGPMYKKQAGTFGHIGCFSFTQGKHLTAGEGGMITTSDPGLYAKCALLRNHAEAVNNDLCDPAFYNLVGFNFRMTEIQAVILNEQIKWIDHIRDKRKYNIDKLMKDMPDSIQLYETRSGYGHSYYVMPLKYSGKDIKRFVELVKKNLTSEKSRVDRGVPIGAGYITPLYRFPCFRKDNRHWSIRDRDYATTYCKNAEQLNNELIVCLLHGLDLKEQDIKDIQYAFKEADRIVNG